MMDFNIHYRYFIDWFMRDELSLFEILQRTVDCNRFDLNRDLGVVNSIDSAVGLISLTFITDNSIPRWSGEHKKIDAIPINDLNVILTNR